MQKGLFVAASLVSALLALPVAAQELPPPDMGLHDISMPDMTVELGQEFTIPVFIDTREPSPFVVVHIENDPSQIRLLGWAPGAGLSAHIDEHGEPPQCDIIIFPDGMGMVALMMMVEPYDSTIYGREWLDLRYEVTATQLGTTGIVHMAEGREPVVATIEISEPIISTEFLLRGDVNNDATCNLTDAVNILGHLFLSNTRPIFCLDAADINDDGSVTITDPVQLLNNLFLNNSNLDETCRRDDTPDALPSCTSTSC